MRKIIKITILLAGAALLVPALPLAQVKFTHLAQPGGFATLSERGVRATADTVLAYQFPSGGWPKNHPWHESRLTPDEASDRAKLRTAIQTDGIGSTIDNGATTSEILFLMRAYGLTSDARYLASAVRGIEYLLSAQYGNGGWPQFWPSRKPGYDGVRPYSDHITFNDDAMVNVMRLLRRVALANEPFDSQGVEPSLRERCQASFDKGVQCILDCQIRVNGQRTVWCQQHDEKTLLPAAARAYELPSFTAHGETVGILMLLMELPNPSVEVREAVSCAIAWLEDHKLVGVRYEYTTLPSGKKDRRLVHTSDSTVVSWARYYDLETGLPFYCDRDGVKRADLNEVGPERRNGYSWIGDTPLRAIEYFRLWIKENPLAD